MRTNKKIWAILRSDPQFCSYLYKLACANYEDKDSGPEGIIGQECLFSTGLKIVKKRTFERLFGTVDGEVSYETAKIICAHINVDLPNIILDLKQGYISEKGHLAPSENYNATLLQQLVERAEADTRSRYYRTSPSKCLPSAISIALDKSEISQQSQALDNTINMLLKVRAGELEFPDQNNPTLDTGLHLNNMTGPEAVMLSLNPLVDPMMRKQFIEFIGPFLTNANKLIGWAPFLPCSLESPLFMEEHHNKMFERRLGNNRGADRIKTMAVEYSLIGHENRDRTKLQLEQHKKYIFIHILHDSGYKQLIHRDGDYEDFSDDLYKNQFEYLSNLLSQYGSKIGLHVSPTKPNLPKEISHHRDQIDSAFVLIKDEICLAAVARRESGKMILISEKSVAEKVHQSLMSCVTNEVSGSDKVLAIFAPPK